MKTLTISLLIGFISIVGLSTTRSVPDEQARSYGKVQKVLAEEQFGFTTETNLVVNESPFNEMDFSEEEKYVPSQFRFLKDEHNDHLFYKIVFDIFF